MNNELIQRSNTTQFYQDCDFLLESKYLTTSTNRLELIFSINQVSYDIPVEYEEWKIVCENFINHRGLDNKLLLPYVKMKILEDHPLLWDFKEVENDCYIKGIPKNLNEFYGELATLLEEKTGNWIKLSDKFRNLEDYFQDNQEKYISLSNSMKNIIEDLCKKYNLEFRVQKSITGKEKGYFNRPDSKLLIFGNEQVCPNDYDLNQPYVIAENFEISKIK